MLRNLKSFTPPELEEKVLALWKEKNVFKKSITPKKGARVRRFNFWEGPPTANGRPGIHHVLARAFKDVVLRFKTMQGFIVPRKGGWDTHGLPVELQVEKQLGFTSKKDIEAFGVASFNQKCKESVWLYKSEWEKLTERMGYWLDLEHPYVTYHKSYMESLWWIIKQIWDKGLLYKGHKVVPWCTRCGTALSSHELAQGYKEVTDTSVYVKFKLLPKQKIGSFVTDDNTFILSWTTTPWTLPGNVALAVGEKIQYKAVKDQESKEVYILAYELIENVLKKDGLEPISDIKGKDLVGLSYEPLFNVPSLHSGTSYRVYPADFVTTTDGTGVVHTAVMYGEDDYVLGKEVELPQKHTVDEQGFFTKEVVDLAGLYAKDKKTEETIVRILSQKNLILSTVPHTHDYPHCWRCGTPLLYYARSSWFVAMSKLRAQLIESNKDTIWVPSHIKEGRFGEWLSEVKDWNFSRERYWGTPLPIWECSCGHQEAIGSYMELSARLPHSTNRYIFVRHGEAGHNIKHIINSDPKNKDEFSLTKKGEQQVAKTAAQLKKTFKRVDALYSSDFIRARETASIIARAVGASHVHYDPRLREIFVGSFEGEHMDRYHHYYASLEEKFIKPAPEGESLQDVAARVWDFISACEKKHTNETIVVVSHEYPIWMLEAVLSGWSQEEAVAKKESRGDDFIALAESRAVECVAASRDEKGFADYHKPYIDAVTIPCKKCGAHMTRVKEVVDVWFDSGAMPFAQSHYPFGATNNQPFDPSGSAISRQPTTNEKKWGTKDKKQNIDELVYPAEYISEAIDQTRGWFYTLLAVATLLGKPTPYKNIICLGHINDKNGQKMSKSKGNIVDPWGVANKYGMDAIRWYLYSVNSPGDPKNFDEDEVAKIVRSVLLTLYNSFVFLNVYGKDKLLLTRQPAAVGALDTWIYARVAQVSAAVRERMDAYDITKSTQLIEEFIDDLSRWYIRRSRKRFQRPQNAAEHQRVSAVLAFVLFETSKIIAPFLPFFAEELYQSLVHMYRCDAKDSVHLASWPQSSKSTFNNALCEHMTRVRSIASLALALRAELGIKVRQPLATLTVKGDVFSGVFAQELLDILKEEVNVKNVVFDKNLDTDVILDTVITPELRAEGLLREMTRVVQDLRQEAGYVPQDTIALWIDTNGSLAPLLRTHQERFAKDVGAYVVNFEKSALFDAEIETKVDDQRVWVGVKKETNNSRHTTNNKKEKKNKRH